MPASQFDPTMHLMDPDQDKRVAGLRAGPCGGGPIDDGFSIVSMQIWISQETRNGPALATGRSGEDPHKPEERPPYTKRWMLNTGLDVQSGTFQAGPAEATAIAIFEDADGNREVQQWKDPVQLHADEHH
jgi:hypothetical protein